MSKIRIEAFVSIPPCSGGVAVKRLLKEIEAEFGDQVEIVYHTGPGDGRVGRVRHRQRSGDGHWRIGQIRGSGAE